LTRLLATSRYSLTLTLLAVILFALVPIATYANYCNHVNITNNYPSQVNPGDRIRIVTTIILNCNSGPSSYEGDVSIIDSHGLRLTGTMFFVSPVIYNEDVTTQATDWVVAPQIAETWKLRASVDLYLPVSGGLLWNSVYSNSSGLIEIQVGSPTISTNTTTSSQISTQSSTAQSLVTKTLTTTVSSTISLVTALTSQVQTLSSKSPSAIMPKQQFYVVMSLFFAAELLIALAIILKQLRLRAMPH